jgi:hypothetical protein
MRCSSKLRRPWRRTDGDLYMYGTLADGNRGLRWEEKRGRVQRHEGSDSTYNAVVGQRICVFGDQSHLKAREIGGDT